MVDFIRICRGFRSCFYYIQKNKFSQYASDSDILQVIVNKLQNYGKEW